MSPPARVTPQPQPDESDPLMVEVIDGWFAVGNGWAVFASLPSLAVAKYREAQRLHAEIASRDVRSVWIDDLPPGGYVCGTCGEPTESEPCAKHQPVAYAGRGYVMSPESGT